MRVYDVAPSLLLFRSVLSWTTATTITTRHRSVSRKATFMSLQTQMDDSLDIFHDDNGDPTNEIANDNDTLLNDRRHVLERIVTMTGIATMAAATVAASPFTPLPAQAADEASSSSVFTRETKQFGYSVKPPSTYQQSSKPVKTHLDEINFISDTIKGCQFGITVDPVRINSLKEVSSYGSWHHNRIHFLINSIVFSKLPSWPKLLATCLSFTLCIYISLSLSLSLSLWCFHEQKQKYIFNFKVRYT